MAEFRLKLRERASKLLRAGDRLDSGQGLAEYAFILMLIALVCAAAVGSLGSAIAGSAGFSIP